MIRLLILLMTLNALFSGVGFACVGASDLSKAQSSTVQVLTSETQSSSITQQHCTNSTAMDAMQMQVMDCDSTCCISCLGMSAVPISLLVDLPSVVLSLQVHSGTIHFYTRSISPELQPPLV